MSYQHTSAVTAAGYLVVLGAVLTVPGLVMGLLLRLRGAALWGLAAPFSVTVISVGGVLAAKAELAWRPLIFLVCAVGASVAAGVVGLALRRWPPPEEPGGRRSTRRQAVGAALGGVVAAATVALSFRLAFGSPRSIPAQPDAAYHLNQIRHMLETRDISSLTASGLLHDTGGGFYPAAWHGIVVTALQVVHIEIPIASNLLGVVAGAVVWTSGCILLARQAFGPHGARLAFAGVLSASFTAMPYYLTGYGVLWPNLLGMALVPALLACFLSLLGRAHHDVLGRARAVAGLSVGLPGMFLAHPNGVASLVLLCFGIVVLEGPRWAWRHRRTHPAVAAVVVTVLLLTPVLWWAVVQIPRVHNLTRFYAGHHDESPLRAVTEALLNNPRYGAPLWAVSALVLVGLVRAARRRDDWWQIAVWLTGWLVFIGVAGFQNGLSRAVTGVWYNNTPRLAAITPVGSFILAVGGLTTVAHWAHGAVRRLPNVRQRGRNPLVALGTSAVLLLVYILGTGGNYVREHAGRVHPYIHPYQPRKALLNARGYAALLALGRHVPAGARVANNPWRGTSLLYALTGRDVLYDSEKADNTAARDVVAKELYLAADPSRPDICAAVRATGVTYVVAGGTTFLPDLQHITRFPGIDRVPGRPGFQLVATAAPYSLWKLTACPA
jgi:hypothetical protein